MKNHYPEVNDPGRIHYSLSITYLQFRIETQYKLAKVNVVLLSKSERSGKKLAYFAYIGYCWCKVVFASQ